MYNKFENQAFPGKLTRFLLNVDAESILIPKVKTGADPILVETCLSRQVLRHLHNFNIKYTISCKLRGT